MAVVCTCEDRNLIAHIQGEIDHHTSEEIREKMEREYERHHAKNVIFDLNDVTFMDSSGIGMILGRYKAAEKQGGQAVIAQAGPPIERLLQISGLHKIIQSYPDIKTAVESLQGRGGGAHAK